MIDALIAGRLHGKPVQRIGNSGKPFTTCKVRVSTTDSDAVFVGVIAFSNSVQAALLALDDGDSVSLSGALTPGVWTDKNGESKPALNLVAHAALTSYHIKRKRDAMDKDKHHAQPRPSDGLDDDDLGF